MVSLVVRGWCFLVLVLALLGLAALLCTDLHRQDKYRDLSLFPQFEMLPSALLVLNFHASRFRPNRLNYG